MIDRVTLPVARKIANLTQKELASACKVSENTVINWEKGRSAPSIFQAQMIGEATGIPFERIIFFQIKRLDSFFVLSRYFFTKNTQSFINFYRNSLRK